MTALGGTAEVRLLRGIPTRLTVDGVSHLLGIHSISPEGQSATIGVHVDGDAVTTLVGVGDSLAVGSRTYVVAEISGGKVVLESQVVASA